MASEEVKSDDGHSLDLIYTRIGELRDASQTLFESNEAAGTTARDLARQAQIISLDAEKLADALAGIASAINEL